MNMHIMPNNKLGISTVKHIKHKLRQNFLSYWMDRIQTDHSKSTKVGGNKLRSYRKFKVQFKPEVYLNLEDFSLRKALAQFRLGAHRLRIETDRFNGRNTYIPPEKRICQMCSLHKTEDELHFLTECPAYEELRAPLYNQTSRSNKFFTRYDHEQKMIWLLSNEDLGTTKNVAKFIKQAMSQRGSGKSAT